MAENINAVACESESQMAAEAGLEKPDMAVALQEDVTTVPLSSLKSEAFVDSNHPNKVLEGLNRLRLNGALCDVILCCGGQEFPCHRYVMASFSPYFEAMFTAGMMESTQERVTISGVEPQMIGMLVSYAYTSKVSISPENVQALLAASNMLQVTAVRDACCGYMGRHIDVNNCVAMYCFAEAHSFKKLEKRSLDYILEDFSVIYQQEEFLSLPLERLTEILCSDHLNVPKEDIVFEAAMLWLNKCPTRMQNFDKVLEHIRPPLISPSYLPTVIESLDVVKEYEGCKRFISEATDRDLVPYLNTAGSRRPTVIVTVGADTHDKDIHKMESFDPLTNQWKPIGRTPLKVNGHSVVISGSIVYLAGGYSNYGESAEMWRCDVPSNSWTKMAPMNKPRCNFSLVMLDGYVYAIGGNNDVKDSIDRYDPKTDTWKLMESVGVEEYYDHDGPRVVPLDGLLYFIGGLPRSWNANSNPSKVAKYNPETSVWTEVAPMQTPRSKPAACTLNGKIYVLGGRHIKNDEFKTKLTENSMECYNPTTNQWTMCAPMQRQRYHASMIEVNGRIYVLGGMDAREVFPTEIERYCEESDKWETVGQMHTGCYNLRCVSLRLRKDHKPMVYEDYEYSEDSEHNPDEDHDYFDYDVSYEDEYDDYYDDGDYENDDDDPEVDEAIDEAMGNDYP